MLKCTKSASRLYWEEDGLSPELAVALQTLSSEYAQLQREGRLGRKLLFEALPAVSGHMCEVVRREESFVIRYTSLSSALRGVGFAMGGAVCSCSTPFGRLGVMLDVSRNRVMTVAYIKSCMAKLALLGYNTFYLYCEDVFTMEGEPYFGFMRGAYTMEEIRELDAWAQKLGIELVACLELLGHFEQVLKWPAYRNVQDTPSVMLADCEETYALTAKILDFWSQALHSRRIHLGMDEAHDLGRGRYYDQHGDVSHFELFNRHLSRISQQCRERGLHPMIWSDMYFRIADRENHNYYAGKPIPPEVAATIPGDVQLVYWDYYQTREEDYRRMLEAHQALGRQTIFASGVWSWSRLWYDHCQTMKTTRPGLAAARAAKTGEVFFAMWGDDGSYCDYDSLAAGLLCTADMAYGMDNGDGTPSAEACRRYASLTGGNLAGALLAGGLEPQWLLNEAEGKEVAFTLAGLLFDDPLLGIADHLSTVESDAAVTHLCEALCSAQRQLRHYRCTGGGDFTNLNNALKLLALKLRLRRQLVEAYRHDDRETLNNIATVGVVEAINACCAYRRSFSRQWNATAKPFGVELIEGRIGALTVRFEVLAERLGDYLDGEIDYIPELEYRPELKKGAGLGWVERIRISGNC